MPATKLPDISVVVPRTEMLSADAPFNTPKSRKETTMKRSFHCLVVLLATLATGFTVQPAAADWGLESGVPVEDLSGARNSERRFVLHVPQGATRVEFTIRGQIGDADIYVRHERRPTRSRWDWRPYRWGSNEDVVVGAPEAGLYYVMLHGYSAYEDVTLEATIEDASSYSYRSPNGFFAPQCTWLVDHLTDDFGWHLEFSRNWGRDARLWWTLVTNAGHDPDFTIPGDIMVLDGWSGNEAGHVGLVVETDGDRFTVVHANWPLGSEWAEMEFEFVPGSNRTRVRRVGRSREYPLLGFLYEI